MLNKKLYKVYLDLDFVFYSINYGELSINFVYDEKELYDVSIEGIPAYFKVEKLFNEYEYLPEIRYSALAEGQEYAILTYKCTDVFSTKSVATIQNQKLVDIKIITHHKKHSI